MLDGAANDPENRQKFLQRVADQADQLHALILDLLSLARIESGTKVFAFEDLPLTPLVADCLERHRERAEAKNLLLEMDGEAATMAPQPAAGGQKPHLRIWADAEAVRQILDNLVDNAVKYTPDGGRIKVHWWLEDEQVSLEVEDTGIGIPAPDLQRIFERFYRVDRHVPGNWEAPGWACRLSNTWCKRCTALSVPPASLVWGQPFRYDCRWHRPRKCVEDVGQVHQ